MFATLTREVKRGNKSQPWFIYIPSSYAITYARKSCGNVRQWHAIFSPKIANFICASSRLVSASPQSIFVSAFLLLLERLLTL